MASSGPGVMSEEDRRLLEIATPGLMETVELGATLLAQLRKRKAITEEQEELITVWFMNRLASQDHVTPLWL